MKRVFYLSVMILIVLASCSPKTTTIDEKITSLENQLKKYDDSKNMSEEQAILTDSLFGLYEKFADENLDDERSPLFLFRIAEYKNAMGYPAKGAKMYEKFQDRYPEHKEAAQALWRSAIIFESVINDIVHAKKMYNKIIEEYPESREAADSKVMLDLMETDKSPSEIIEELQKKNSKS
jgi:tetratricopeptide (TPR) repeat protein